ncbi:MAG: hypothetical protein EB829_04070 [Nitrosopumilus sp. H8]|nr:MAG: hypothetical protein EB829_04070 [Nitrosopumilus sp. H8]
MSLKQTERSDMWMLVGFFLGIIGGVIAYHIVKKDDRDLARKCLYIGMMFTVVWLVLPFTLNMGESDHVFEIRYDSSGLDIITDDLWLEEEFASFVNEELDEPIKSPTG